MPSKRAAAHAGRMARGRWALWARLAVWGLPLAGGPLPAAEEDVGACIEKKARWFEKKEGATLIGARVPPLLRAQAGVEAQRQDVVVARYRHAAV